MRVALHAQAPVLLVADIDRGGVFAHLYGTLALLEPDERALVRGALINRFRGDVDLLRPGNQMFEARSGVPVVGVVPFLDRHDLPDEDSVRVDSVGARRADAVDIAVIRLPRTSNATDFEPLARQPSVRLRWVDSAETLGRPDLVIVPGSKSTVSDLGWLRDRGIGRCITALAASGTPVAGICGGFQMLGQAIHDPDSVESRSATTKGLSLLPVETFFSGQKRTERVEGSVASLPFARGQAIVGYEIHMGHTRVLSPLSPAFELLHGPDGAVAPSGLVWGTYLHGLFDNAHVTAGLIDWLRARRGLDPVAMSPETPLDARIDYLADQVEASTDVERILSWLELPVRA
jgi:adenosylcobyric acid synthase